MSDNLGTLAGLIADLEHRHDWVYVTEIPGDRICSSCEVLWPCPTIDLTRKHKRAQYRPVEDSWGCFVFKLGADEDVLFKGETLDECEAWIEKQVNGDE